MTAKVTTVFEACDPYPAPRNNQLPPGQPRDHRHSRWLTEVLDRLDEQEIRQIARTLAVLHPREFEQELVFAQHLREVIAAAADV